jgi:hypothetical protein
MADSNGIYTRTDGVYSGNTVWGQNRDASVKILAELHDTHDEGFATALTNRIKKNGDTTVTASLPMAGYKWTNVADAWGNQKPLSANYIIRSYSWHGTSGGAASAYTLSSVDGQIPTYSTGMRVLFLANHANTGNTTLDIDSEGAQSVLLKDGSELPADTIISGQVVDLVYENDHFVLQSRVDPADTESIADNALTADKIDGDTDITFSTAGKFPKYTVETGVTATGSSYATAYALTKTITEVTVCSTNGNGVALPSAQDHYGKWIALCAHYTSGFPLTLYAAIGDFIGLASSPADASLNAGRGTIIWAVKDGSDYGWVVGS